MENIRIDQFKEQLRLALVKLGVPTDNISKFLDNPDKIRFKDIKICFAITDYIENLMNPHLSVPVTILSTDTFNKLYKDYLEECKNYAES